MVRFWGEKNGSKQSPSVHFPTNPYEPTIFCENYKMKDIEDIVIDYCRQMDLLRVLLDGMSRKYRFLQDVEFKTLDDILRFTVFAQTPLPGVCLIQCHCISKCRFRCRCEYREIGVWIYTPVITHDNRLTVGCILKFIDEMKLVCEHEEVSQMLVDNDMFSIFIKRK